MQKKPLQFLGKNSVSGNILKGEWRQHKPKVIYEDFSSKFLLPYPSHREGAMVSAHGAQARTTSRNWLLLMDSPEYLPFWN